MRKLSFLVIVAFAIICQAQISTNGLVAYYPFSGNANDLSGNGINATVSGATLVADRAGNASAAYYFNGTNARIQVPHNSMLNYSGSDTISISCWIKPEALNNGGIWCKSAIGGVSNYCMTLGTDGKITAWINQFGAAEGVSSTSTLSTNQWYHIVVVYAKKNATIFINNILDNSKTFTGTPQTNTGGLYFGDDTDGNDEFFKGVIDDIRIYRRALTIKDINSLYTIPVSVTANREISLSVFELLQNYPNPFNPATIITYTVPHSSVISLKVFDILGKEVATLVNEEKTAGTYKIKFDGNNLSSGIYFYILRADNFTVMKKFILLK